MIWLILEMLLQIKTASPYVRMSIHVGNQVMEFSNITSVEHNT